MSEGLSRIDSMTGYILIVAVILLGGAIATLGDRLGSRVGKARLSLFNLRPKKTAVLVTILTGSIISASTLGILLATSRELRDAVFRIDEIVRQSRTVRAELESVQAQKSEIQGELSVARADLTETVRRLRQINESLKVAVARQKVSEANLKKLQGRYETAQTTLRTFSNQAKALRSQIKQLASQRAQLAQERQGLIQQRNQVQSRLSAAEQQKQTLETSIARAQRELQTAVTEQTKLEQAIREVQSQLQAASREQNALRQQRVSLEQEITALEANRQQLIENLRVLLLGLRRGNVTIRAGQVLASGVVQNMTTRLEALQALNTLLLKARQNAIVLTNPSDLDPSQQVVQMRNDDVEQLTAQLSDGNTYAVRILSALNYLEGETQILVVPQAARNVLVFEDNTVVASLSLTPAALTDEQILARINQLFTVANREAIQAGILPDPVTGTVGSFRQIELFRFVLSLKERNDTQPVEIQAVTTDPIYAAGPLTLDLVAQADQKTILRSAQLFQRRSPVSMIERAPGS